MAPILITCYRYAKLKAVDHAVMRRALRSVGIRGRFNPEDADRLLANRKSQHQMQDDPTDATSYSEAERRWKCARAAQEELKVKRIQGILVLRKEVAADLFAKFRSARDRLANIPARLSALLAAETDRDKVQAILAKEFTQALEELADAD